MNGILRNDYSNKSIDDILEDLVYEYESSENVFQKDNLLNRLIIDSNGDREKAMELYHKQESIYDNKTDLLTLFTNIVLYSENYKVSNETKKIALAYVKNYILEALSRVHNRITIHDYQVRINEFVSSTKDGTNLDAINKEIDSYLSSQFDVEDKDLLVILIIINILGIIGIFFTLSNTLLCALIVFILIIGNLVFFTKLSRRNKVRKYEKDKMGTFLYNAADLVLAEIYNCSVELNNQEKCYESLVTSISNMNVQNYLNSNGERNIDVGDYHE